MNFIRKNLKPLGILIFLIVVFIVIDFIFTIIPKIWDFYLLDDYFGSFHNSYLQGIVTNIIGAIITLLFLDRYIKEREDQVEKIVIENNIKNSILAYDYLLSTHFVKVQLRIKSLYHIDLDKAGEIKVLDLYNKLKFSDIKNCLRTPGLLITDNTRQKLAINYYYEDLNDILNLVEKIITNINFQSTEKFISYKENLLLLYTSCKYLNTSDNILEDAKEVLILGKDRIKNLSFRMLNEYDGNEPKKERENSNVLTPYVILHNQIKTLLLCFDQYQKNIILIKEK